MFRAINGELIVIVLVLFVLFGTKRLREIGSDLGAAVRGFRKGLNEEEKEKS